jgi:DNA-binding transcriptional MocR family regulator
MNDLVRYRIVGRTASAIARSVEQGLRAGELRPGDLLPTVRELARRLRVSPGTVAGAWRELRARGLVTADGRRGTRLLARPSLQSPLPAPVPAHLRNLAEGNPDPALLPPLARALARTPRGPLLYGAPARQADFERVARADFERDGIPAQSLAVVSGALDGLERLLMAHLRPGDRVAVEDPSYTGVLDLLAALGLAAEPVEIDESGPLPAALARVLRSGADALLVTPRAQNPTGAALDTPRAAELRRVLEAHPAVFLVEDDHAGPVAGVPALTLSHARRERWAVVRSVSKALAPDLRVAAVAGDAATLARVEGRQALGCGWVSHVLQAAAAALLDDPAVGARLERAAALYAKRRRALVEALAQRGIAAWGRSGMNVWVPVPEESAVVAALAASGWAVRAGERYRLRTGPAVRVTTSTLAPREADRFAADLAAALHAGSGRASRV